MDWRNQRLSWILAGSHLALTVFVALAILNVDESDWPMAWIPFLFVDFPVSLIWVGLSAVLPTPLRIDLVSSYSPLNDVMNYWIPVLFLSLVGTPWWFLVGRWIDKRRRRPAGSGA